MLNKTRFEKVKQLAQDIEPKLLDRFMTGLVYDNEVGKAWTKYSHSACESSANILCDYLEQIAGCYLTAEQYADFSANVNGLNGQPIY